MFLMFSVIENRNVSIMALFSNNNNNKGTWTITNVHMWSFSLMPLSFGVLLITNHHKQRVVQIERRTLKIIDASYKSYDTYIRNLVLKSLNMPIDDTAGQTTTTIHKNTDHP